MYERELTQGGSYQYHTCVDKLDEYDIDLYDYEINITPKNETSPYDYIHSHTNLYHNRQTYQHKYDVGKSHPVSVLSHTSYI